MDSSASQFINKERYHEGVYKVGKWYAVYPAGKLLSPIVRAFIAYEAHSVAVDPQTHRVYFPLQNVNGHGVLRIMAPML